MSSGVIERILSQYISDVAKSKRCLLFKIFAIFNNFHLPTPHFLDINILSLVFGFFILRYRDDFTEQAK